MGKLFKIEMKKLRKSTAMMVMLIVAASLSFLSVAIYGLVNMFTDDILSIFGIINGYSMASSLTYSDSSDIMVMVVILMAVLIGGDFSARTLQTQVAAGYSRFQIIVSRFLSIMVAYLILYVVYFTITVVGTTLIFGFGDVTGSMVGELVGNIFLGIIMAMTMLSMYMLFAFLLKSVGGTIGVCLPFMLIGTSIINMVSAISDVVYDIISFTPFGQSWELTMSGQSSILGVFLGVESVDPVKFICVCVVWFVGFMGLTFLSFRKAELK